MPACRSDLTKLRKPPVIKWRASFIGTVFKTYQLKRLSIKRGQALHYGHKGLRMPTPLLRPLTGCKETINDRKRYDLECGRETIQTEVERHLHRKLKRSAQPQRRKRHGLKTCDACGKSFKSEAGKVLTSEEKWLPRPQWWKRKRLQTCDRRARKFPIGNQKDIDIESWKLCTAATAKEKILWTHD